MMENKYANALIKETSPYLLQHAHNPVQWYPWGEEALSKAKNEDKPILLSIGYSACHWCHVMAHESFEDERIAQLMNEYFVNIKVDREERPDLDAIYMAAVQLMTGSGGWPMTVFLTPDCIPFYCGTYFPREDRYGMPGFRRILLNVAQAYKNTKQALLGDAESIVAELRKSDLLADARSELNTDILEAAASGLTANYDAVNGGFGRAPKFPPSMALSYLMRSYKRTGKKEYLDVVNRTLTKMAYGGIYDQLGGGFHRYSVDATWLVPHFEKMLYDNALLSRAYLDAYLLTKNDLYRRISQETLDYVMREMTSPEGGFYSSQDADSEGKEGAFFVWHADELESLLGEGEAGLFTRYYSITRGGNFEGLNILHVPVPADEFSRLNNIDEMQLSEIILRNRKLVFDAREMRAKPGRDEKALTSWNGLMLRSFAEAANALDREDYRKAAIRNGTFLLSNLRRDGKLLRSFKDGQARFNAYLEDYACLIDGLISLYEATFDPGWIGEAENLAELMVSKFWDRRDKGFFFTSDDHESLIHRPKEFYDNATPSGNSVAAFALLRLWKLTGSERWSQYSTAVLEIMADLMPRHPSAFPHLLCALDFLLGQPKEVAIIGDPGEDKTRELLHEVFHTYLPNKVVACGMGSEPFLLKDRPQVNGSATAYVCENFTCALPVTTPIDLAAGLGVGEISTRIKMDR
jgi:uncharacterized protein YyaL (SSP411 family)